jgi:hypothetical protein
MRKVIIGQEYTIPCFPQILSFIPKESKETVSPKKQERKVFEKGKIYTLSGVECDDFEMPTKEYELIGFVSKVNGIVLDSVIMKQISGEQNTIFSLTKNDCRNLNIEFQPGLQLFPKNLNWVEKSMPIEAPIKEEKDDEYSIFNPNDLSSYPVCHVDKTVRHIMVEISGFTYDHRSNNFITPDGNIIKRCDIGSKLKVTIKRPLYGDGVSSSNFNYNEAIGYKFRTNDISTCTTNNIIDKDGKIYIELMLHKSSKNTPDGALGVHPEVFNGQSLTEIFEFFYLEFETPSYTQSPQPKKIMNSTVTRNDYRWGLKPIVPSVNGIDSIGLAMEKYIDNMDILISNGASNLDFLLDEIRREKSVNEYKIKYGL